MLTIRNCSNDFHLILQRVHRKSRQNIYQSYVIQIRYMADSNRDLIKAEKFLKEGDYEEAILNDLGKIKVSEKLPNLAFIGIKKEYDRYEPMVPKSLHPYIISYSNRDKVHKHLKEKFEKCNKTQINPKAALCIIKRYNNTGKLEYRFP